MTNREYINQLSNEQLAELLISEEQIDEGDYDCYDNWNSFYVTYYGSPCSELLFANEDEAFKETIKWLSEERK